MARITVEDCLLHADNRFQLVLMATQRARQIARGARPLVEEENDKPTVLALREIAAGQIDVSILDAENEEMEADSIVAATADPQPAPPQEAGETPAPDTE